VQELPEARRRASIDPSDWDLASAGMLLILTLYVIASYMLDAMHAAYM
jgi:hypothetical protein